MANKYKVWVEVEEYDLQTDEYRTVDCLSGAGIASFPSMEQARVFGERLQAVGHKMAAGVEPAESAQSDVEPEYIPATLRGLPVLLVQTADFKGLVYLWDVFCPKHRSPAGCLRRSLTSGDYRYYPQPELVVTLGMTKDYVKFPASEVKIETPAEGGGQ